jgi:hypothetical protein
LYLGVQQSTLADFDAAMQRTIAGGFNPDIVLFDSPDHLRLGGKTGMDMAQRWAHFADLYNNLAGRAKQYDIALWVTNQADEAAANGIAMTKHARDSQQKVKDASVVMSINRLPEAPDDQTQRAAFISKFRNKPAMFRVDLEVDLARMLIKAPYSDHREVADEPFVRM